MVAELWTVEVEMLILAEWGGIAAAVDVVVDTVADVASEEVVEEFWVETSGGMGENIHFWSLKSLLKDPMVGKRQVVELEGLPHRRKSQRNPFERVEGCSGCCSCTRRMWWPALAQKWIYSTRLTTQRHSSVPSSSSYPTPSYTSLTNNPHSVIPDHTAFDM